MKYAPNIYVALAHLQNGSANVSVNQKVKKGELLGKVGHSGNSTSPHLHFHLMDSSDFASAKGIPCAFEKYELWHDDKWIPVLNGIPSCEDRIRFTK